MLEEQIEGYEVHYSYFDDERGKIMEVYREFSVRERAWNFYKNLNLDPEMKMPFRFVTVIRHREITEEKLAPVV